ncbi:MAG: ABC transporter permease [Deltaproteobacteria bacterium]|nr:ABC transporter permease [Deltaproteobacteria bacterium]
MKYHPLWELTRVRFLEFIRDPEAIFWVFVFPVILALVLGVAFTPGKSAALRVAVTGEKAGVLYGILGAVKSSGRPSETLLEPSVMEAAEAAKALKGGKTDLVAVAGPSFPQKLSFRLDPARPGAREAALAAEKRVQEAFGRKDPVLVTEERFTEKSGRYIDFLLPALIGFNIMSGCMWGMGYAIVDFRRKKLIKRFAATPMNRAHFLLAFILSRVGFLVAEAAILLVFAILVFKFAIAGSLTVFGLVCILTMSAFAGIALLIAARATSTESASGWMNLVQVPMWLFSGSFFSYDRFPEAFHPLIRLLPLTAFNDSARLVLNEGAGIGEIWSQCAILAVWGTIGFFLALRIFRWK